MIEDIGAWVRDAASGPIAEATFDGFNLSLGGGNWGFGSTSPWRIVEGGDLVAGCGDPEAASEALKSIIGTSLVDVSAQSPSMRGDPVLVLSSGQQIEVFSDTQIDPWTFVIPGMTYVGTPGDSRHNR
jgi:hypothetical protein